MRRDDLVPWAVVMGHRWAYPLMLLRTEDRRRSGLDITEAMSSRSDRWSTGLAVDGTVVHYDAETVAGFSYVERRPGRDLGFIREPDR